MAITLGAIALTILGNYLLANRQADTQLAIRKKELQAANTEARRTEKVSACSAFLVQANAAWQAGNDFYAKALKQPIDSYRDETRTVTTALTESWLGLLVVTREPTRKAAGSFVAALNHFMQTAAVGTWDDKTKVPRDAFLQLLRWELQEEETAAPPSAIGPVPATAPSVLGDSGADQRPLEEPVADPASAGATASSQAASGATV